MTLSARDAEPKLIRPGGRPIEKAVQNLARLLLAWYDRNRRDLPWRARPGERNDPYRVWVSEVMLQQTTAAATIPYYERFVARFPTVRALAAAELDEVLRLWAGLGYYARARNLHACARAVIDRHAGQFPRALAELCALPGIGAYTAAAVAAIAFDECAVPVDGNVERVVARLFAIRDPLPRSKAAIRRTAERLAPRRRAGDFAQALMDLGATLCTPRGPACVRCPLRADCAAAARGDPEAFPAKAAKRPGRLRRGAAFVVLRADGCVLLRTRPAHGLLGGMTEVPTTDWTHDFDEATALASAPILPRAAGEGNRAKRGGGGTGFDAPSAMLRMVPLPRFTGEDEGGSSGRFIHSDGTSSFDGTSSTEAHPNPLPDGETAIVWLRVPGVVTHVFTHFPLELFVFVAQAPADAEAPAGMRWVALETLDREALPNLMRKVIAHAGLVRGGNADAGAGKAAGLRSALPAPRRAARRSR